LIPDQKYRPGFWPALGARLGHRGKCSRGRARDPSEGPAALKQPGDKQKPQFPDNLWLHTANSGLCSRMDWQQLVSLLIVAGAAIMLLRGKLRRPEFSFQRSGHCGCGSPAGSEGHSSIIFRARKGERPVIIVKQK